MPQPDRKPLAQSPMESRVPKSVWLEPSKWTQLGEIARARCLEPAVFAREILTTVISIARIEAMKEAPVTVLGAAVGAAQVLAGSPARKVAR